MSAQCFYAKKTPQKASFVWQQLDSSHTIFWSSLGVSFIPKCLSSCPSDTWYCCNDLSPVIVSLGMTNTPVQYDELLQYRHTITIPKWSSPLPSSVTITCRVCYILYMMSDSNSEVNCNVNKKIHSTKYCAYAAGP